MEASKRERFILFGAVPIVAAVLGAVTTVIIGQVSGGNDTNQVLLEIVKMEGLTPDQRLKLMTEANAATGRFYNWLSSVGLLFMATLGFLGPAISARISGR